MSAPQRHREVKLFCQWLNTCGIVKVFLLENNVLIDHVGLRVPTGQSMPKKLLWHPASLKALKPCPSSTTHIYDVLLI